MQPRYVGDKGDSLGGVTLAVLAVGTFLDISDCWGQHLRKWLRIQPIVSRTGRVPGLL